MYLTVDRNNLMNQLREKIVTVTFDKMNGERRVMKATLLGDVIRESFVTENADTMHVQPIREKSEHSLSVWDVDKDAWRSFRLDRVIEING